MPPAPGPRPSDGLTEAQSFLRQHGPVKHKLALAGLAELIHNAADADAQRLDIQVTTATKPRWEGKPLLSFSDNGMGMEPESLVKMLKFCQTKDRATGEIGKWGVGFKHGTLRNVRVGSKDQRGGGALIFTRADASGTMSIGLFSPDCLIEKELSTFPMISFDANLEPLARRHTEAEDHRNEAGRNEADKFWQFFDRYAPISRREAYRTLTTLPTVARNLDGALELHLQLSPCPCLILVLRVQGV